LRIYKPVSTAASSRDSGEVASTTTVDPDAARFAKNVNISCDAFKIAEQLPRSDAEFLYEPGSPDEESEFTSESDTSKDQESPRDSEWDPVFYTDNLEVKSSFLDHNDSGIIDASDENISALSKLQIVKRFSELRITADDVSSWLKSVETDVNRISDMETLLLQFPQQLRVEIKACIERYRDRMKQLIYRTWLLALGPKQNALPHYARAFQLMNSDPEGCQRLLDYFTDPRVTPLDIQLFFGMRGWLPDVWNYLQQVDVKNPLSRDNRWSVYMIRLQIPHPEDLDSVSTDAVYIGSTFSTSRNLHGQIGQAARFSQHEVGFRLIGPNKPLFVYRVGSEPGIRRSYHSCALFPAQFCDSYSSARLKASVRYLEDIYILLAASLDGWSTTEFTYIARGKLPPREWSQWASSSLRPRSFPQPRWQGLNRVLPMTQNNGSTFKGRYFAGGEVLQCLRTFSEKTRKTRLSSFDIRDFEARGMPTFARTTWTEYYRKVLMEKGITLTTRRQDASKNLFLILWAIAQYVKDPLIIYAETEDYVFYNSAAIDWEVVAQLAQSLLPSSSCERYTKQYCWEFWHHYIRHRKPRICGMPLSVDFGIFERRSFHRWLGQSPPLSRTHR
jgi:hypothetical protein